MDVNRMFPLNKEEFYAVYLNFILRKDQIGYGRDSNLDRLQDVLGLKNDIVQCLHEKVEKIWYEKALKKCLKNGVYSHGEEKAMASLARHLRLPEEITSAVRRRLMN